MIMKFWDWLNCVLFENYMFLLDYESIVWKWKLSSCRQSVLLFVSCSLLATCLAYKELEKSHDGDLVVASSIAVKSYKTQATGPRSSGNSKYGYPYNIAPTLTPLINSRSDDDDENEAVVALAKPYGSKLSTAESDSTSAKKGNLKKPKDSYQYGANRRQGYVDDEVLEEQSLKRYKEPKYRNFDELESRFKPRRIDLDIPYSEYYRPKSSRPHVSQRDPYLSPSKEPVDSFYPVHKPRSYSTPYRQSGRGSSIYGTDHYEDSQPYYDGPSHGSYSGKGYDSPSKYPPNDEPYNYQEDYTIESNKPIIGDIRKRLLDYAGASDLYEGEPDYLRQVAQNKHKYGHIGNDYYAYGRPEYKKSYRDFPYVESKVSLIKKSRLSRS